MLDLFSGADSARLLPFLWVRGEDEEALRRGVRDVRASGCGAVCAESRTHPDFLGARWWRDVAILLDECETLGMRLWIFDDRHFPSGYAAGAATDTPCARMLLTERHMDVLGPVSQGAFVVADDARALRPGEGVVAVVAARRLEGSNRQEAFEDIGGYRLGELVDLTGSVSDGMAYWDVPEGIWRVFVLSAAYVLERNPPKCYVNPLIPQGGRMMLDSVYRPHWERFGAHFGKTLAGFFSDEPSLRAGRGYHGVLGEYPRIPIPWCADMPDILRNALGEGALRLLPGLWYDIGDMTGRVRYQMMHVISRLYGENYSAPIGDWCRAHHVEYIGHVIEQNNAHCRLGSGAGHYFRAMQGQDIAGIDIVLHEVRPELRGGTHAWHSQDFEADDDFFRFMLGQMAVSCAHLDPKKKNRALCEIFGAYGWQEDVAEMRYLANLMLSRGVNHFVPHAFTLATYPDPDSPPHFDPVHNPLMPFVSRMFGYMARVGAMIDGGRHVSRVAVLYHGEAEWANGTDGCMKTQAVVKALNEAQIECEIVPIESLDVADFDLLLIPWARSWPKALLDKCRALQCAGKAVRFIDALPLALCEGEGAPDALLEGLAAIPLAEAPGLAREIAPLPYEAATFEPRVHLYPYQREDALLILLFNEDARRGADYAFTVRDERPCYCIDQEAQTCRRAQIVNGRVNVSLEPGQLLIVALCEQPLPCAKKTRPGVVLTALRGPWRLSLRAAGERAFAPYGEASRLTNLTAPDALPRFSGTIRYERRIAIPPGGAWLDLGECSGSAEAWLGGQYLGARIATPYRFPLPAGRDAGNLRVEVTNAPVFRHRDALSFFACVKPTGMLGPVTIREGEPE